MTKEIYHEGWLIKSPPTKRIWRARWRRRWFTLKQGEIPEQFCLEYYKDRSCRKLKGVIDLDQCEQVDSGLKLEHRNQKFQHMFDVKTPLRTYYLAASSEEDMNAWVNCICEVCNLQDLSKPQQPNSGDTRQYYNITNNETSEQQAAAAAAAASTPTPNTANPALMVTLKSTTLSPVKSANASSDQVALLPTAEPIDNNNSVYQNYDAMCRNSSYNNRETLVCDVPLNKIAGTDGKPDAKESYYNFMAIANTNANRGHLSNDSIALQSNRIGGAHRKIPENLKLSGGIMADVSSTTSQQTATSSSSGPYIAISDCISGNPLIDRTATDNPTTPLNSLDPKFYDTPRSHFNIGLNLTNEQPYSPKRNNIQTLPSSQIPHSGKSSPTDSESVFTDDEDWMPTIPDDTVNGERRMRPSESSVENDPIVFRYTQRFSKLPDKDESVVKKRAHAKKPHSVAGLSLEKNDSEEQNKDVNSSDTENASPAIAYGPKDMNSYVDESYDIPRSHQLPYTKMPDGGNSINSSGNNDDCVMELGASGTCSSMLELSDDRSSLKKASNSGETEFSSSTMPKRRHFYTNAAPAKVEGTFFRYDFEDKQPAPIVHRNLKPKLSHDDTESKLIAPSKLRSGTTVKSALNQPVVDLKPPCIDDIRKLKPTTPIKLETSTLRRGMFTTTSDIEFRGDGNNDQFSKTLPRNYNNSASSQMTSMTAPLSAAAIVTSTPMPTPLATIPAAVTPSTTAAATINAPPSQAPATGRQAGVLEYFDLDHSNPPPICNNSGISASTSNLITQCGGASPWQTNLSHRLSSVSISSSSVSGNANISNDAVIGTPNSLNSNLTSGNVVNPPTASGIVYKSVDFIKTEAFMRTRQDAELARAKNRSKE